MYNTKDMRKRERVCVHEHVSWQTTGRGVLAVVMERERAEISGSVNAREREKD